MQDRTNWVPPEAAAILARLEQAGQTAWLVGGCVRDHLLGRPIHDWDIATSALPEEVVALFPKTVPTGLRHGTVTVLQGGLQAEVTTFRTDLGYSDGRRPDGVRFVSTIEDDLARRDFTINAMAMDRQGRLLALYGGLDDLAVRQIRCGGDPDRRCGEDALRMLRALRFSAQLGFSVEEHTRDAISRCAPLAEKLSAERVRDEVEKALCSPRPQAVSEMAALGLLARVGLTDPPDLAGLTALPPEPVYRWAGFLRASKLESLAGWKLPKAVSRTAGTAVARCRTGFTDVELRRLTAEIGPEAARVTAALCGVTDRLEAVLGSGCCLSLKELAVTGRDFPSLSGPALGQLLRRLLDHVLEHPEDNSRNRLLEIAEQQNFAPDVGK